MATPIGMSRSAKSPIDRTIVLDMGQLLTLKRVKRLLSNTAACLTNPHVDHTVLRHSGSGSNPGHFQLAVRGIFEGYNAGIIAASHGAGRHNRDAVRGHHSPALVALVARPA